MASDNMMQSVDADKQKAFYVYLYRDPRPGKNNEPIYVGKGKTKSGNGWRRADYHWLFGYQTNRHFKATLLKIRNLGLAPLVEIIDYFDIEADALATEVSLIKSIGRLDQGLGPLRNKTDGGDGVSGYIPTKEVLEKHRIAGELTWENASPELRKAMSKTRDLWKDPEHHAIRSGNCAIGRAKRWLEPGVKAQDSENIRQAKLADRDAIVAKAKAHIKTPEHIKNSGDAKRRDAAEGKIGRKSEEVWEREGLREFISERISEGTTAAWAEPRGEQRKDDARESVAKQFADPVKKEKHSKGCSNRMKADWADPVKREIMLEARRVKKAARLAAAKDSLP